jgi:hypothetical protein
MTVRVNKANSGRYRASLVDETGVPVPAASLSSLTLTLYDQRTDTIINSRDAQDVLNVNGVTVDANGLLTWTVLPADNPIVTRGTAEETHVALFEWTFGSKRGSHEVHIVVVGQRHA